jgi:phosphoserine aminotransferase
VRPFNFSPGPATLPTEVLEQARDELLDWRGNGTSVMELSHRSKAFCACAAEAEADLRELLAIPANYRVLFMQGGATAQFAIVPMNLVPPDGVADYINTGHWSRKALSEAQRYCRVNVAADAAASHYCDVPPQQDWQLTPGAAYVHYTPNETIGGVEFPFVPEVSAPLVADMSSTILSRPLEVSRYALIYAGAQKNIGPAGLCVVIVREDLLDRARSATPAVFNYGLVADDHSMLNTPPTFAWYMAGLVFKWLKRNGGLTRMAERNRAKAERLYRAIDGSGYYRNIVAPACRSWMNVPFTLPRTELDPIFVEEAARAGLLNLKGHRLAGGMRASLYNAMPPEGVEALVAFMGDFARRHA